MRRFVITLSATLAFVLANSPVHAVIVTNETTGTTVFHSNGFEHEAVGPGPTSATVGSWAYYHVDSVIDDAAPGAALGSKYVRTIRDNAGAGGPGAILAAAQNTPGDHLHAEWYARYAAGGDANLLVDGSSRIYGRITGGQYLNYDGAFNVTGVSYVPDQWQKWELDYVVGASTYTLSIDDAPPTTISVYSPGGLSRIDFAHSGNGTTYLDGVPVPEPSALALLSCGIAALIRRRR